MKLKKPLALTLALVATASFAVACKVDTNSSDGASSPIENSESSSSSWVAQDVTLTVTVKKEDGTPMSGITFMVMREMDYELIVTDEEGKASYTNKSGTYYLSYESGAPYYHTGDWMYSQHELEITENKTMEFVVIDETPNGSKDRPFHLIVNDDGEMAAKLPASAVYHYVINRAMSKNLVIESDQVEVAYKGKTYTAEGGKVTVPLEIDNSFTTAEVAVTNKSTNEINVNIRLINLNVVEGSIDNPFMLTFGEETTAMMSSGDALHYKWTATAAGTIKVTCDSDVDDIKLDNHTHSIVTGSTEDGEVTLEVSEGDVVFVIVSLKDGATAEDGGTPIAFTVNWQ